MSIRLEEESFAQYRPGLSLNAAFPEDKVPLLQMEHLRQLDFMIGRGLSYENTINAFFQQLYLNESMRSLKERQDMVVLLDNEGALVRDSGVWAFLFTPGTTENQTLSPETRLYPVYIDMLKQVEEGRMVRIFLPVYSERSLLMGAKKYSILDEYAALHRGGFLTVAKNIVVNGPQELYQNVPVLSCGALKTVDVSEIDSYSTIRALMQDYAFQYDHRMSAAPIQPLSIAVFGAPGSGKSFGIKEIAGSVGRFRIATINCSQFRTTEALFLALHRELTESEDGSIPLIFFDEFDSTFEGTERGWLKYFLAPMQDGEYTLKKKTMTIDAAVFVFAGGTAGSFAEFLPQTEERRAEFRNLKGPDFVSRLKGMLDIKGPNPTSPTDRTSIIRRALLFRNLIIRKYPAIYDENSGQINISRGLLSALLRVSEYRHGSRSLEFILAMSKLSGEKKFTPASLPPSEQLDIHLDVRDFRDKIMFEQFIGAGMEATAKALYEIGNEDEAGDASEPPHWNLVGEDRRENYRSIIRFVGEHLMDPRSRIGIRHIIPDAPDTLHEPEGEDLRYLCQLLHEGWRIRMISAGWRYDEVEDRELLRSPRLAEYESLSIDARDAIEGTLLRHIRHINRMGYEFFRKFKP